VEILNDFIGADKVLDRQENGSSVNNFRRIFHRIFSTDNLLVIPFLIIIITVMVIVFSGGLKKDSPAGTDTTSITENITTTKEIPTTEITTEFSTTKAEGQSASAIKQHAAAEKPTSLVTEVTKPTETQKPQYSSGIGSFKSYTDYRCLSRSSPQWKLQEQAYTDENGLRKIGDAYLVAMGSYYGTTLGTKYTVTLSNGNSFTVMLCDGKADRHTDANNQVCLSNGSVIEFYVESDKMPSIIRQMGSVGALEQFSGSIVSIEKTT
jgi:hypothetical protein